MEINYNNGINHNDIIDIRPSFLFEKKNINGSINIPKVLLMQDPNRYLSLDRTYYLICESGASSLNCARVLNALGFSCYSIKGGIKNIM